MNVHKPLHEIKLERVDKWHDIYITYAISIDRMPQNVYCSVEYRYSSSLQWIRLNRYSSQDNIKYPGEIHYFDDPTTDILQFRFFVDASPSGEGRCFVNSFSLYGILNDD